MLKSVSIKLRHKPQFFFPFVLFIFSLLERIWLLQAYQPISYSDTYGSYFRLAGALASGGLRASDGTRVPGYPLLIALFNQDVQSIWIFQLALGLCITQLLYWMGWFTSRNARLSFTLGLLYNLIPGQFLFESNLLSETLTTFLILLAFLLLILVIRTKQPKQEMLSVFLLGIASSLPGMVRPVFFPITVWLLLFVFFKDAANLRTRLYRGALFSLAPLIIQGGWILNIYSSYGMLSPTTMGGYSLVQHTGAFFELLPQDSSGIRDTYLEYRDARILERGVQTNTIWDAIPALAEASGMNFFDLSREMKKLSLQLIKAHPGLYLKSVVDGWVTFWKAPVYWDASVMTAYGRGVMAIMALLGRLVSIAANILFLLLSVLQIFLRRLRLTIFGDLVNQAVFGLIWLTSILQTLVDHGDNPRFLMPLQMIVIFLVLRAIWPTLLRKKLEAVAS